MALDQSALLDPLAQLKLTDVPDRIRVATETLYQELIDAEATAFIGAAPFEPSVDRRTLHNGSRRCGRGHSPPPCSSVVAGSAKPCSPS
jgi:putative transposase